MAFTLQPREVFLGAFFLFNLLFFFNSIQFSSCPSSSVNKLTSINTPAPSSNLLARLKTKYNLDFSLDEDADSRSDSNITLPSLPTSASAPLFTSAEIAALDELGLLPIYDRYPHLRTLVNFTWIHNGQYKKLLDRAKAKEFDNRHRFTGEELSAPKESTKDVPNYLKQPGADKVGLMVDFKPQFPNPPEHEIPISSDFQRACREMNLLPPNNFWYTCHKTPAENSRLMPRTTHILVTAIYNAMVEPGWCHPDVPGNVFTPSKSFYYQAWTMRFECYDSYVRVPGGFDYNSDSIEYYPQLLNSLNVYGGAPGHFGPQQLPRIIRLLLTAPAEAKLLVSRSTVSEQLMDVLIDRKILDPARIVWFQPNRVYMGGVVYQSHVWPYDSGLRYAHDRTDMRTVHDAMVDDLPDEKRKSILIIKRESGSRSIENHDEMVAAVQDELNKVKAEYPDAANSIFDLDIEIFKAAGHMREHIAMFQRAPIVIAPHGAGLFNVMFCKPHDTAVMEIGYNSGMTLPEMYFEMSAHSDLDYYLIRGSGDYCCSLKAVIDDIRWSVRDALLKLRARRTGNGPVTGTEKKKRIGKQ